MMVIQRISKTRQKKLLEFLANMPFLDDTFNFSLSRRESFNPSPLNRSLDAKKSSTSSGRARGVSDAGCNETITVKVDFSRLQGKDR